MPERVQLEQIEAHANPLPHIDAVLFISDGSLGRKFHVVVYRNNLCIPEQAWDEFDRVGKHGFITIGEVVTALRSLYMNAERNEDMPLKVVIAG
jgi:hypothetical protein